MLGGGEMVAVEKPDSVARKQRGQGGDHRRDDRLHPFCSGADQRGREDRFEVVEFVVDRLDRHADGLGAGVKGSVDGGVDAVNNQPFEGERINVLSCRFPRSYQLRMEAALTPLNDVFERFAQDSPVPVMVRALLENTLSPQSVDELFENVAERQYTRTLLFSSVVDLMGSGC